MAKEDMSLRTVSIGVLAAFVLLCGGLVYESGFFQTMPALQKSAEALARSAASDRGCTPLSRTTDVQLGTAPEAPSSFAPGTPSPESQKTQAPTYRVVGGPSEALTIGSVDPSSGFKFQLDLTSFGGAVRAATLSEYDNRDHKNPEPLQVLSPVPKGALPGTFKDVDAGYFSVFGVTAAGRVRAISGQVPNTQAKAPQRDVKAMAAGGYHCVALVGDSNAVVTWGQNDYRQCDDSPSETGFRAIAAGGYHSLALRSDGSIVGWGANEWGQIDCPPGTGFTSIAGGLLHSVALKSDGSLIAWGDNRYGQTDVPTGNGFKMVSAGDRHNVALRSDGSIVAWGDNSHGQTNVPPGKNFTAVTAGANHCIALREDGSLVGWGDNSWAQCEVPPGKGFAGIAAGYWHSAALTATGQVLEWGGLTTTLSLSNTRLHVDDARGLSLETRSWKSLGVQTADDGSETASFEVPVVDSSGNAVLKLTKSYRVAPETYLLGCTVKIENLTDAERKVQYNLTGPTGLGREAFRTDMRGVMAGFTGPEGQVTRSKLDMKALRKAQTRQERELRPKNGGGLLWTASVNKYFAAILVPVPEANEASADWIAGKTGRLYNPDGDMKAASGDETVGLDLSVATGTLKPAGQADSSKTYEFQLYLGPKDKSLFDKNDLYRRLGFVQTIDFLACCCPSSIINPLAFGILAIMKWMHGFWPHNYGIVIIILVFLMRLIMHPITKKSQVSMSKMSKLAPRAEEIKKKYANNKAEMNKRLMALYREQGASPIMGFLPMFVQMPIWIALWSAVYTSIDLRGAAFLSFWITDLSVPDALIRFRAVTLPLFGRLDSFNLLPILMGVAFYLQQKLMPSQASAASNPQMAQQQKIMQIMLPLMFPLMLYKAPSGVNLYIMSSTFAGVIEQYVIRKHIREKEEQDSKGRVAATSKTGGKVKKKKPKPFYKY